MIARIFISIILSPIWLALAILMTVLYAIGYIKGDRNAVEFYDLKQHRKRSPRYNETNEFDIHAN